MKKISKTVSKNFTSVGVGSITNLLAQNEGATYKINRICMFVDDAAIVGLCGKVQVPTFTSCFYFGKSAVGGTSFNDNIEGVITEEINCYVSVAAVVMDITIWYEIIPRK